MRHLFLFFLCLCLPLFATLRMQMGKKIYPLTSEPIDVVIVSHKKDQALLDDCIKGIKNNCHNIGRVIVVSSEKLTDNAEWFDENRFPFSLDDIFLTIGRGDRKQSQHFFNNHNRKPGWYFQQLLKLYSSFVIPDISSNILIVDADVIFMNSVEFLNRKNGGLFCISHRKAKPLYLEHAKQLVPGYERIYPEIYSVCHHMLFQRPILEDLFVTVEQYHGKPFWQAFCLCVQPNLKKGASEYEIYYNFALSHTNQVELRELKWKDSAYLELRKDYQKQGYHFVAFHSYLRSKPLNIK